MTFPGPEFETKVHQNRIFLSSKRVRAKDKTVKKAAFNFGLSQRILPKSQINQPKKRRMLTTNKKVYVVFFFKKRR